MSPVYRHAALTVLSRSQFFGLGEEIVESLLGGYRVRGQASDQTGQVGTGDVGELGRQVGDVS